ncbi:MAG: hypothetical protein ACLFTH_01330 [Candidatus Woesearchaeota archaeon]
MMKIVLLAMLCTMLLANMAFSQSEEIISGHSYKKTLEVDSPTGRWGGLVVMNNGVDINDDIRPFGSIYVETPEIINKSFPGDNIKGKTYYYAASLHDRFNLSDVHNVSSDDLDKNGLFSNLDFPEFYPDYENYSDNPRKTFGASTTTISLGNKNFTAFSTELAQNISYYLLRYEHRGDATPLFLVPFQDAVCYDGSDCVAEFMLPITSKEYNLFLLNKYDSYDYTTWIDGMKTNTFSQTALPYNLTVEVNNLYTGEAVPDVDVLIGEHNGQNIFIPYPLSGYVTDSYTVGTTTADARETFLIAPTVYPANDNYSIFVGVLNERGIVSEEKLYVESKNNIIKVSKPVTPTSLYDDAKTSVNSMSQIASTLFRWTNQKSSAKRFTITYDADNDTFKTYDHEESTETPNPISLKTAAPNVLEANVLRDGDKQQDYQVRIRESQGFLIMNPRLSSEVLSDKMRYHRQTIPISETFVITPTSLGKTLSNVTIEIIDSEQEIVAEKTFNITSDLVYTGGVNFKDDKLKTMVNAMNQILSSLYYSLNF